MFPAHDKQPAMLDTLKLQATQAELDFDAAGEYVPELHATHCDGLDARLTLDHVLALQATADIAAVGWLAKYPAVTLTHEDNALLEVVYVPGGQTVQDEPAK